MRYNLNVPYLEKDEAKSLGARWDPKKRVWYTKNPGQLELFHRWMPKNPPAREKLFAITGPDPFVPMCDCPVLPWEDCEHTDAEIQSIMRREYGWNAL
jgi:hypothetical protein